MYSALRPAFALDEIPTGRAQGGFATKPTHSTIPDIPATLAQTCWSRRPHACGGGNIFEDRTPVKGFQDAFSCTPLFAADSLAIHGSGPIVNENRDRNFG